MKRIIKIEVEIESKEVISETILDAIYEMFQKLEPQDIKVYENNKKIHDVHCGEELK